MFVCVLSLLCSCGLPSMWWWINSWFYESFALLSSHWIHTKIETMHVQWSLNVLSSDRTHTNFSKKSLVIVCICPEQIHLLFVLNSHKMLHLFSTSLPLTVLFANRGVIYLVDWIFFWSQTWDQFPFEKPTPQGIASTQAISRRLS